MENLTWLINLPPAAREAVGYVDFDLILSDSPRLSGDSAYMAGWNEAKRISIATQVRKIESIRHTGVGDDKVD